MAALLRQRGLDAANAAQHVHPRRVQQHRPPGIHVHAGAVSAARAPPEHVRSPIGDAPDPDRRTARGLRRRTGPVLPGPGRAQRPAGSVSLGAESGVRVRVRGPSEETTMNCRVIAAGVLLGMIAAGAGVRAMADRTVLVTVVAPDSGPPTTLTT